MDKSRMGRWWTPVRSVLLVGIVLAAAGWGGSAWAAGGPAGPCCTITGLDAKKGVATARDATTGAVFEFPASAAALKGIRVGQKVTSSFVRNAVRGLGGRLGEGGRCPCGQTTTGACWCSSDPNDLCFMWGCSGGQGVVGGKPGGPVQMQQPGKAGPSSR